MAFNDRNQNVKSDVEQACEVALDFVKRYYESLDRRRHLMSRLYQDTAILVWNGNGITGKDEIQKFLSDLPSCDHSVRVLDSQKILDSAVSNQLAYSILATGTVKYTGKPVKQFAENFIITAEGERWKIVSDSFRFQEFVSKEIA